MLFFTHNLFPKRLNEMATRCRPKDNGRKYPMWIRVEYTRGEHNPPHAHLYRPNLKPSSKSLITKFLITEQPPLRKEDIKVMRGKPPVPSNYANMIVEWAKDKTPAGVNNWLALKVDWEGLEASFNAGFVR